MDPQHRPRLAASVPCLAPQQPKVSPLLAAQRVFPRQCRWIDRAQQSGEFAERKGAADSSWPQFDHKASLRTGHGQNEVSFFEHLLRQAARLKRAQAQAAVSQ